MDINLFDDFNNNFSSIDIIMKSKEIVILKDDLNRVISKLQYSLVIVDEMINMNKIDINELNKVHKNLTNSINFLIFSLK